MIGQMHTTNFEDEQQNLSPQLQILNPGPVRHLVSWYELTASTVFIASRGACGLTRGNSGWGTSGAERIGEAHLDRILMSSIEHTDRNNSTLVMFQQPKYTSATTKTRSSKAWKLGFPIIPSKIYAFSRVF
jgi:hypothetical protein